MEIVFLKHFAVFFQSCQIMICLLRGGGGRVCVIEQKIVKHEKILYICIWSLLKQLQSYTGFWSDFWHDDAISLPLFSIQSFAPYSFPSVYGDLEGKIAGFNWINLIWIQQKITFVSHLCRLKK